MADLRRSGRLDFAAKEQGRLEALRGSAVWTLPEAFRDASEMALLAADGNGVLWLFFRSLRQRGAWEIHGTSLGDQWLPPQKLVPSAGGQNVRMAASPGCTSRSTATSAARGSRWAAATSSA